MMGFSKASLEVNPLCLRIVDAMCDRAGVIANHTLTELGPARLAQSLATELPAIPELPQSVRDTLPRDLNKYAYPDTAAGVARALVQAGETDTAEPSWTVLGRMVQEAQFVHVWRRAHFMRDEWAVDPSDFARTSRPLVGDHPYAALINVFADGDEERLADLDVIDAEGPEAFLIDAMGQTFRHRNGGTTSAGYGRFWMRAHSDDLAPDIENALANPPSPEVDGGAPQPLSLAVKADAVSPFMPAALAARTADGWPGVAPRIDQIEKDFGGHPDVGAALARRYRTLGRTDDLIRVLQRYLKVSPDYWAYEMLANAWLGRGDETAWLNAMEQSLKLDDYALNHSKVNQQIALHFMTTGRYDRAEPYARASAESGADWALATAAECFQGLRKWDEAEEMVRSSALRYGQPETWFMWCVQTGHGHLAQASRVTDRFTAGIDASSAPEKVVVRFVYLLGQSKFDEALTLVRPTAEATGDSWAGVVAALLCAKAGDQKGCDDLLSAVTRPGPRRPIGDRYRPSLNYLAKLFKDCRDQGAGAKLDLDQVEQAITKADESERPSMLYFTGKFIDLRGQEEDARRYYTRCLATRGNGQSNRMLAAMELRRRGIDPMDAARAIPASQPIAR